MTETIKNIDAEIADLTNRILEFLETSRCSILVDLSALNNASLIIARNLETGLRTPEKAEGDVLPLIEIPLKFDA